MIKRASCKKCGARISHLRAKLAGALCRSCKDDKRHLIEDMLPHPFRALSLDDYLGLVRELPSPTPEQRQNFVDYVSTAHSWYKHLPLCLPGTRFYFYVDPSAGCDWITMQDGSHAIAERKKQGF